MSDKNPEQVTEPGQEPTAPETKTGDEQNSEIMERLEALEKSLQEKEKVIQGKDQAYAKLQKEKKAIEEKGLSEQEKILADAKADTEAARALVKDTLIEANSFDESTASLLNGTAEEMREQAKILVSYKKEVLAEAEAKIESLQKELETIKGNIENPGSGKSKPVGKRAELEAQRQEAIKAGNVDKAFMLKEAINNLNE